MQVAGGDRREAVLVVEVDRQERAEADEAAEGHTIERHQPPGVGEAEDLGIVLERLARRAQRAVLGEQDEQREHDGERNDGEAEDVPPAERDRQRGREQGGEHRAGIAGAGDAERRALVLRGIPVGGERQRDGEGRAGDAEHDAERQRHLEAGDAEGPEAGEPGDHDRLHDDGGEAGFQMVGEHASDDA